MKNYQIFNFAQIVFVLTAITFFQCDEKEEGPKSPIDSTEVDSLGFVSIELDSNAVGLESNPLKGMFPYEQLGSSKIFPMSMEWFYLPLKSLQTDYDSFNWEAVETYLNEIGGRGHHAVFRIYLDYPGNQVGTPQFLINEGLKMREYNDFGNNGTSKSPDWNDEKLMTALENFITAFGVKYDGDSRIGFITIGLYGFWGEWHNYPHDPDWSMSPANRDRILTQYVNAFKKTKLALRDPAGTTNPALKNAVGYHDDSFFFETLSPSWAFWPKMLANSLQNNWKTQTTGGELRPELQNGVWNSWPNTKGQDVETSIKTTHVSWLLAHKQFATITEEQYENAIKAQKMMGYTFSVTRIKLARSISVSEQLKFDLIIKNNGVAPFPYNWHVEIGVTDYSGNLIKSLGKHDWKINEILPGGDYIRSLIIQNELAPGLYKLVLTIPNENPKGNSIHFANKSQDKDIEGWITLGEFEIR